jgi:hypothetical protein
MGDCLLALDLIAAMGSDDGKKYTFQQLYACDPALPNFGFEY